MAQRPPRVKLNPNHLLEALQRMLVERPTGWFNICARLDRNLTEYLREDGPAPAWDQFPIARNWYSQNSIRLKEQIPGKQEAA